MINKYIDNNKFISIDDNNLDHEYNINKLKSKNKCKHLIISCNRNIVCDEYSGKHCYRGCRKKLKREGYCIHHKNYEFIIFPFETLKNLS